MAHAEVTYRAVQAVSPGKLELTRKPLVDHKPGMSAYASRPAAFAIPMRRRLRACFRLHGRGCPGMRRWV
jgi:hypothetical protein